MHLSAGACAVDVEGAEICLRLDMVVVAVVVAHVERAAQKVTGRLTGLSKRSLLQLRSLDRLFERSCDRVALSSFERANLSMNLPQELCLISSCPFVLSIPSGKKCSK